MHFNYVILGKTIRTVRKEKGISQEVLSGLAGIARTHLTMIETGSMKANIETVCKIAEALNMRLSELFALVEQRQASEMKNE